MEIFWDFIALKDPNLRWVVLGVTSISAGAALVGVWAFLQKKSLIGDAISHAVLPGVVLSFIITEVKSPLYIFIGALLSGWLAILSIDYITQRSKIKADAAIALVLSVFYGIGILLLTSIQNTGKAAQSGLEHFLFGQAASLAAEDVKIFTYFSIAILLITILFFKSFRLITFDRNHAKSLGYPVKFLEFILSTITVSVIALGIQAVGVVLMIALLITPAASARYWTNNLIVMLILASIFGAFAGISGTFVSYALPKMPTGPWVVMALSLIAFLSVLIGIRKGVLVKRLFQRD